MEILLPRGTPRSEGIQRMGAAAVACHIDLIRAGGRRGGCVMREGQVSHVRLVVIGRDGVINEDRDDFVRGPADWVPFEGSLHPIGRLNRRGILVAVATN